MKIHSRSSKKISPPHADTAALIATILRVPTEDLPGTLSPIHSWKWPRSDLHSWIKVLNKFDAILEDYIRDYDIDKLQVKEFTPITKKVICEILAFERLLLENSTNRKLFNSYDRLSSLLLTSDLDVLVADLQLLLRPAQQYSAQASMSHALNISTTRLQALAKRWPGIRDYGTEFVDLASEKKEAEVEALPAEASEVNFAFYRKSSQEKKPPPVSEGDVSEGQSRKPVSAAPTVVHLDSLAKSAKTAMDVLAETVQLYAVPDEEKFELMCRIRVARALGKGRQEERVKLVMCRLLAIAIYCLTQNENLSQSTIFLYEPDLVTQVAEFLYLDRGISTQVQTAAIAALDGIGRYRTKVQELLTAINAGVNHGILMTLLRRTVSEIAYPESTTPNSFVEALISFVTYIASHASGGNMVVGAGLIPLLIQIIENKTPSRLSIVSKAMQLVDNVVYGFPNAFQLFCNARGIEAVVQRIEHEVNLDIGLNGGRGSLPISRAGVLKHTLRTLHRMMQTSGTSEGLRGLIDSSLIKSIKKIIDDRTLFGSSVLPIAINVMATFVHNEPTSLTVLQEVQLPEAFYKAVEANIEPSIEVIQAVINAIGALCLNQAGQDQLASKPTIIPSIFSIFTSERHVKVLSEKEHAALFGSAVDELIRHHPSLKDVVFAAIGSVLGHIEELGNTFVEDKDAENIYRLTMVTPAQSETSMDIAEVAEIPRSEPTTHVSEHVESISEGDLGKVDMHDNLIVAYVDVVARFLEGLFQHTPHCRDFVTKTDGLDRLGRIITLPCIPYTYASSPGSDAVVQVLRAMADVAPSQTVGRVLSQVRTSLDETREFWGAMDGESRLLQFVDISAEDKLSDANTKFRKLTALHTRVTLLADIFSSASYTHGRSSLSLLSALTAGEASNVLPDLGALHRACIWENIVLKGALTSWGVNVSQSQSSLTEGDSSPAQAADLQNEDSPPVVPETEGLEEPKVKEITKDGPKERNAKALKHIATQIPTSLTPFFQAVGKLPLQYTRRSPDAAQKKQAVAISGHVADVAYRHLLWGGSDDKLASYAYWTVMMGLITVLLFEERTSQSNLHTMLLVAFRRIGGLDSLLNVCRRYSSAVDRIVQIKTEDRSEDDKQELVHVFGGLKVALHLLHSLVSSKPLLESPQTILLVTRDKKDTDPDYFEPQDFLVKMRLTILPFIRELWEASWLVEAPFSVCKSVVQTMLELMAGENEEPKGDAAPDGMTGSLPGSTIVRQLGPDENAIRQLCDMGFPRSAAERALSRTRNNVGAATEFLLAQPLPFPPEPESEDAQAPEITGEAQASNPPSESETELVDSGDPTTVDTEMVGEEEATTSGVAEDKDEEPAKTDLRTPQQYRQELSEGREPLKEDVGRRALRLLDEHPSLIFDLKNAFIGPVDGYSSRTLPLVLHDIREFSPTAYDTHEQPLAIRCRLLALVLNEIGSLETRLPPNTSKELMDVMLALLLAHPANIEHELSTIPKWLASHLLVTEALLVAGDEPLTVSLPQEEEEIISQKVTNEPAYPAARQKVFEFCLRLLKNMELPRDELIAVLRLLVHLTRDHGTANEFVRLDGIGTLLERFKSLSQDTNGCQLYVAIILRHIIENQVTLESIMRQEVKRWFSQPRTRVSDVTNYIRNTGGMALRDPKIFVRVTESMCQLVQAHPSVQHISLKSGTGPASHEQNGESKREAVTDTDQMSVDEPSTGVVPTSTLESMVHHLISELMRVGKTAVSNSAKNSSRNQDQIKVDVPTGATAGTADAAATTTGAENDGRADYLYACFLMQCLTELLFSYNSCKAAFVTYTKKKGTTPAKDVPAKHRATVLNFLLSELTSFGTQEPSSSPEGKRRIMLCNWAMSVIVALCVHVSEPHDSKDLPGDFVSIRKLVLDALSRAIKEPLPAESIDERYGRLLALADLCHRLLTVKAGMGPSHKPQDDSPLHMAKLMLEKNYVSILTNALSEVDLNYPNVRGLVTAILRPLEHLSKVAIKMGRSTERGKEKDERLASLGSELSEQEEVGEGVDREETPDLYRNSALGIYGGEMDDGHNYVSEDEMDEDEEVGDEVDMEFGEEDTTGSENTSTDSEEEDPHGDELDIEANGSEEGWHDGEEDDDGMNDDEDDEDHDGVHDEDEHEITWQDVAGAGPDADNDQGDDMDEEDVIEGVPLMDEDEADEDGMNSEEDEMGDDIGLLEPADLVHADGDGTVDEWFGELTAGGEARFFTGPPISGRRRSASVPHDLSIFSSQRSAPGGGSEGSTHPLLVDPSGTAGGPHSHPRPSHRRTNRGNQNANAYTDLLQTIEDLVSGGALQLFQQLMSVGRGGPGELHIDLAPMGAHLVPGIDRNPIHRHGRTLFASHPSRPVRVEPRVETQDFGPLPTLQRWSEEAKMTHGKFVTERVNKLSNHVTLALLPAARKAAKEAEKAKEEEKRYREEEEAAEKAAQTKRETEHVQESQDRHSQTAAGVIEATASDALTAQTPEIQTRVNRDEDTVMEDNAQSRDRSAGSGQALEETATAMEGVHVENTSSTPHEVSEPASIPPADFDPMPSAGPSTNDTGGQSVSGPPEPQRVTVMIHGNAIDITDTGIDPTFLDALPDDMREEVLNQHFRERRTARQEQPPDSQISPEFLDALPPEIRAEILQQESTERARVHRAAIVSESQSGAEPTGPVDIDPASFLATLDPQLRQVVLMDQEDGFLQTLPSHMIAEAGVWREGAHRRFASPRGVATVPDGQPPTDAQRKPVAQRDAIQLLDKNGLATLVRLLFFPQLPRKNLLLKIFVNLCENGKTRGELLNLLLHILQEGTGDLAAVDKSFAQLSFRSRSQPQTQVTPKSTSKAKAGLDAPANTSPWQLTGENVPNLVVQRSLEALTFIVSTNESAVRFFLSEHDIPSGLKRSTSRKGKGKEKQVPQLHYPIVLLLALLDRQILLRTPSMMDSLAGLLATVTRPLATLIDETKKDQQTTESSGVAPITGTAASAPDDSVVPEATTSSIDEGALPNAADGSAAPVASETIPVERSTAEEPQPKALVPLISSPPLIPQPSLRLIVNILTVGECSGRTFQSTLALIQHLSVLSDARDTIASELKSRAQDLGHSIYTDLDGLVVVLQQDNTGEEVPAAISAKFSPASSDQAKLLRILKTIDYMYSVKHNGTNSASETPSTSEPSDEEKVHGFYDSFRFAPLWRRLGDCLSIVEQKPDVEHMATVLLPLIESLMVVCKYVGSKPMAARLLRGSASPRSPSTARESMEDLFLTFTDTHRKILNLMVRNNPSLMSGSFALLVQNPRVLDFDNKRNYFYQQLRRRPHSREHHNTLQLNVRRARVFEDSYQYLQRKTGEQIKYGKLSIRFYHEEGVDAGGVTREWFQILARQMFNPNYALFQPCAADKLTYQPNRASWVNPEHLSFFKFVGRIIGKAIFDSRLLDAYFARSLYRQLLGKPVDYRDVEWVDPEYYNSLIWILENDPTALDLTFSTEADEFGITKIVPLKENGASIPVTQENKREFVQLSAQYRLTSSIKEQIDALLGGFYDIIPKDLIAIFNEQEVELLISGTPDIDIDEWRAATEYNGYTGSDPVIVWWWRALKSFDRDERAKVLSFTTGTSRVPLGGFVELQGVQGVQRFSIHKAYGESDRLPQAHTCFNQIDLPQYTSYEMLRRQLLLAINEGGEGFGFA